MQQNKYVKTAKVQEALASCYPAHKMDIYDLYSFFASEQELGKAPVTRPAGAPGSMSDAQFEQWLMDTPYTIIDPGVYTSGVGSIDEAVLFDTSPFSNIHIRRCPNYFGDATHSFAFFEMCYLFRGQCDLETKKGRVALHEGDFLIIAPGTSHSLSSDDDNFILGISVRKSDFEDMFRAEQSRTNLLSLFFRHVLFDRTASGYLLFHTGSDDDLKHSLKNVAVESMVRDDYSFMLAHCWLSILLSNMVRMHHLEVETSHSVYESKLTDILQYIQQHYQDVTLDGLGRRFGYTKPYLCTLIKHNTGKTFSQLVNAQRLNAATTLLREGRYSVAEIAHHVGYANVDYFSRRFKREYGVSPAEYRARQS